MANRERWCTETVSKLANDDNRIYVLNEIKEYFSSLSQEEASKMAKVLQLPIVFDCLNDSRSEQIDLACDVLALCMSNLSLGESTSKYGIQLERSLYHPSTNVKIMALKEIYRTAINPETVSKISKQPLLITALVGCIGHDDLTIAKKASDILILVGKHKEGLKLLLTPGIKLEIIKTIDISDIVRFRIYEILVEIATESSECLQSLLSTGLISTLSLELESSDPLLKLNVIEIITNLARSSHGLNYLEGENIVQKIISKMSTMDDDPLAGLLLPGYLKFFGNVAYWRPTVIFAQYPYAILVVFNIINSEDLSVIGVAFDTLGHIGSTVDGKYMLQSTDEHMAEALKSIGTQLSVLPTDLKIRALNCVENLLRVPIEHQNNRVCSIVENWFNTLHHNTMSMLMPYAQNPFIEIRCAGLNILQALAELFWGQQIINNTPGLIEFLLDRKSENTKEAKEIKYEIIKSLSVSSVFTETTIVKLQRYVKEGAFYVQAVTEVAIEGSS